jgi:hypothetical protein
MEPYGQARAWHTDVPPFAGALALGNLLELKMCAHA